MILVLGSKGLLGSAICRFAPHDTLGLSRDDCEAGSSYMQYKLKTLRPEVVINCIGVVDKRAPYEELSRINAGFPWLLEDWCNKIGARLIHISTDCVFNGERGNYREDEKPNTFEHYGLTKWQGEVWTYPHLTVRTSFVGLPDLAGRGLLAWYVRQGIGYQYPVEGYKRVLWNGLTTYRLAETLLSIAENTRIRGIRHVFGETVSKYDVLLATKKVYGTMVKLPDIIPVDEPVLNRTLATTFNDGLDKHPSLMDQLITMKEAWSNG